MSTNQSNLKSLCDKLNSILGNLEKPIFWSLKVDGEVITLLQFDKKRELTQTMLSGHTIDESYLFLKGYYLALRNLSMSV